MDKEFDKSSVKTGDFGSKLEPFVFVSWLMAKMILFALVIPWPAILFMRRIPYDKWPSVYVSIFEIIGPVALSCSVMALIYGFLRASKTRQWACAIYFGLALSIVFITFLSLSFWIFNGIVLHVVENGIGLTKIILVCLFLSTLGTIFYRSVDK